MLSCLREVAPVVYAEDIALRCSLIGGVLLCACARTLRTRTKWGALFAASAMSGIWSALAALGVPGLGAWYSLLPLSLVMLRIAFGPADSRGWLKRVAAWAAVNFAAGGCMLAATVWAGKAEPLPLWVQCLCLAAAGLALRCGGNVRERQLTMTARHNGHTLRLRLLYDSGCSLTEPVSGLPVIAVRRDRGLALYTPRQRRGMEEGTGAPGLRAVPFRAFGGRSGILWAVKPGELRLGGRRAEAWLAVCPEDWFSGDGITGIGANRKGGRIG